MTEQDKHRDQREVEREVDVEQADGTTVQVETEREASHEHATRTEEPTEPSDPEPDA